MRLTVQPYFIWVVGAAAKMASVVTLIIEKTMKKKFKKKIISNPPTLIFSRYETGTTGIFFTPDRSSYETAAQSNLIMFIVDHHMEQRHKVA
jgi:hypothetical protein